MGLYNFKERFAPFILDGSKTHTIRGKRKHPDRPGNTLHLFTGLRTRNARLLMRQPCVAVHEITIEVIETNLLDVWRITIDGDELAPDEMQALAWSDGFRENGRELALRTMMAFWKGRLPFLGHIIHWQRAKPVPLFVPPARVIRSDRG